MIRTVTLTANTEMHVSLGAGDHASITNKSVTASLYAAGASDVVAGEDGAIEIAAGMSGLLPDCKGEVYLLSSDAAEVQLISTNALNANFNKAARGGESGGSYVDLSSNQTIGGEKTFTKGVYAVDGVFASGYTQTSLPTDIEGVAMYKSGAISRIAALIKSAASVITYKALALGAYVGGKYSAMFNANGTVDFNFDVTVPTQAATDNSTKAASTTCVDNKIAANSYTHALSILTSAWAADTTYTGYGYRAAITDSSITTTKDVDVAFDMASVDIAQIAVVGGSTVAYSGGFYIYAMAIPTATLTGTFTVKAVS